MKIAFLLWKNEEKVIMFITNLSNDKLRKILSRPIYILEANNGIYNFLVAWQNYVLVFFYSSL